MTVIRPWVHTALNLTLASAVKTVCAPARGLGLGLGCPRIIGYNLVFDHRTCRTHARDTRVVYTMIFEEKQIQY